MGRAENSSESSKKPLTKTGKKKLVLTYEHQYWIVASLAMHVSYEEIVEQFKERFGFEINENNVAYYSNWPKWKLKREKIREEFESKIMEEPLASKRRRVQELTYAFTKKKKAGKTMDSVRILSVIRDEIEGKTSGLTQINQYNQYNQIPDEDLRKIIDENTKFLEIAEKKKEIVGKSEPVEGDMDGEGN